MLDIKDIKGLGGEELLKSYEGRNPYINYMKKKYLSEKSYFLTTNQSKYVKKFFNFEPRSMNKVIELTNYFAEQLKEEYKLKVPIKKILIETLCNSMQYSLLETGDCLKAMARSIKSLDRRLEMLEDHVYNESSDDEYLN